MSEPTRTCPPDPDQNTRTSAPCGGATTLDSGSLVAPPGYELHDEIGSGGMGLVYRTRDLDLNRDVAVKILHPRYRPDSPTARRFLAEARITGRLQHPGIPAVYRVGTLPNGRPFLAMKLIGGHTLDELLKVRVDPTADRGRFLAVFEQVCQAVGYAHSREVLHRDLKPANVMVGDFGEVQVMDWGLAKDLRKVDGGVPTETDEPAATVEYAPDFEPADARPDLTQAGTVLGTPAYMPPEQAIGAVDKVAKPSDVFGLGAILCAILTGKPPFAADTAETSRQLAARANLDDALARLDGCRAEPELVALAKRCLAPEPAARPGDAGEVAKAVASLRTDAEQRARQAEMDRARAEVKSTEERKRRRVQRALALAVLGLVAITGFAAWWVESVRSARKTDQLTRDGETRARHLATERDVVAALNEAQLLREEGWKQADDPARWALTLTAVRSAFQRAEGLVGDWVPTDEVRLRLIATRDGLRQDDRDRTLMAELDRIEEENDFQFLLPISITAGPADRYATAFRSHGIDLATIATEEPVAWLKGHRFRDRLTGAVRNWHRAYPAWDLESLLDESAPEPMAASAAVAGEAAVAAFLHDPNRQIDKLLKKPGARERLDAILKAVTDDPFAREWWNAVARDDKATLKQLLVRPEIGRMSSRELSSLADGLADLPSGEQEVLAELLRTAYDRFPGEFWVNFRLAASRGMGMSPEAKAESIRYLSAAVAARPRSAIARVALGAELWELRKDNPTGPRMVRGAAELDPTSVWPHIILGYIALETGSWDEAFGEYGQAIRAERDIGFFMAHTFLYIMARREGTPPLPEAPLVRFLDGLVADHPDHPGGYDLRAEFLMKKGDHRAALGDYRAAKARMRPDYLRRIFIITQLDTLEPQARWMGKLPAVLRGELKPTTGDEFVELAGYCAGFEKKYATAARFAAEAMEAFPDLRLNVIQVERFAGWAVQAAVGNGTDAADLSDSERSRLRRQALTWIREATERRPELRQLAASQAEVSPDLTPVLDPRELAKLPPGERVEWERLWSDLRPALAPLPRPRK